MIDDVKRLIEAATGYAVAEADMPLLSYLSETVRKEILADINQEAMPDGLYGEPLSRLPIIKGFGGVLYWPPNSMRSAMPRICLGR